MNKDRINDNEREIKRCQLYFGNQYSQKVGEIYSSRITKAAARPKMSGPGNHMRAPATC